MTFKARLHQIIFGTDTKAGKLFDIILLYAIIISIMVVTLDSVAAFHEKYKALFLGMEILLTIIFSIEYIARIIVSPNPIKYIFSFYGIIDLLCILPTFISLIAPGYQYLIVVRIFRLLRVFRILKLTRFSKEAHTLTQAVKASSAKIGIFIATTLTIVFMLGTIMYVIEGGHGGFTSIPVSIYWAVVTVTTVGYGDMVPQTILGKILSGFAMLIGYSIIAIPTGLVSAELMRGNGNKCKNCGGKNRFDANYCGDCGEQLQGDPSE